MTLYLYQPEPDRRPRPRSLDPRSRSYAGRPANGAAYGLDENEMARLLAEAPPARPERSPLEVELEGAQAPALWFL